METENTEADYQPHTIQATLVESILELTESEFVNLSEKSSAAARNLRQAIQIDHVCDSRQVVELLDLLGLGPEISITFDSDNPVVSFYIKELSLSEAYKRQDG